MSASSPFFARHHRRMQLCWEQSAASPEVMIRCGLLRVPRLRRSRRRRLLTGTQAAPREHTKCHARTGSGGGVSSPIPPSYFLCTVRLDALDLGSTNTWAPGERLSPSYFPLNTLHFTLGVYPGWEPKLKSSLGKGRTKILCFLCSGRSRSRQPSVSYI